MGGKKDLRKFAFTMAIAFLAISGVIFLKHKPVNINLFVISGLFLASGIISPEILSPIYSFWMKLAQVLSWINTRIILIVIFYIIFAPVGLIMRLLGADLLDRKLDMGRDSYWLKRVQKKPSYERQF